MARVSNDTVCVRKLISVAGRKRSRVSGIRFVQRDRVLSHMLSG